MKTITGIEIKVTPNYSKRTFTIRKYFEDGTMFKYRTCRQNRPDFESMEQNSANDWQHFLRSTDDYYLVQTYYKN